jgi:hypothetical protein
MGINKNYKRGIFLLILLLTVISGATIIQNLEKNHTIDDSTLSTSAPEDFYEPNNDPASAYDLTMNELTWLSMINGPGAQWDEDWYNITVSPGEERLVVKLIFKHLEGDIDLDLYNSTLNLITRSDSVDDGEFIDIIVPSGLYHLRVWYGNAGNNYDLLWDDISPAITDDNYEENDGSGSAEVISANQGKWLSQINGLGIQADDDWFEIYVNLGFERLIVDCIFSNDSGNIDMDIYNGSFFLVANSWTDQNHEHVDFIVPSYGVYFIRLHSGNGGNTYDLLWDSLVPGPMDDAYEPNDFNWEAYDLSPWPASWLPFGLGIQGNDDWYIVQLDPGEERLKVDLIFSHTAGNIDLEVWYWDGPFRYLAGSHSLDDNEYLDVVAPWSGIYFIKVFGDNASNTYDLWWEDNPTTVTGDDWMEPNDDFSMARWVDPNRYDGLRIVGNNEDWFRIWLNPGDVIDISIYFKHIEGDLELELYDPSYGWRAGSYSGSDDEFITYTAEISGDWRIRVYQVGGNFDVYYDLDIWLFPGGDDAYEFNNRIEEAYFLGNKERTWLSDIEGLAVQRDFDFFMIDITPGFLQLVIELTFNHTFGNIDISIFEEYNTAFPLVGNYSFTDNEHIDFFVPHPGIYFIQVHGDSVGNEYDLWWDDLRTDFRPDDYYEDNDNPNSATDLTYEISHQDEHGIKGRPLRHINENGLQYDHDWYKIYVGSEFLQLRVLVLYEHDEGDLGIQIYDWELSEVVGNFTESNNVYIDCELPSNGTYYILIYGDNTGSPYDIFWELRELDENMIPGYDILILLSAVVGVTTVITLKWKRSKKNH